MSPKKIALLLSRELPLIYRNAHCELQHTNPLELLIATILSAQCTDVRVNKVTPALFHRCPSLIDYASISQEELETIIHSTGFYRSKASSIRRLAVNLIEKHNGEVPHSMEELSALPGVGRKTANVVLSNAFGINDGVVVDTHVARLSQRLGLTREHHPIKIEQALMKLFARKDWGDLSHWLIWHGRRCCRSRNPNCTDCELRTFCPSADHPDRYLH
ncbi:MAG TPA: endonuclease III [Chthoniobacterales bacterium]|nr:endonuclease III [Chthoniobacterales bacterium]